MKLRLFLIPGLLILSFVALAAPDLLIVQLKRPIEAEKDPNMVLSTYVAEALDKEGRVRPIVWSSFDPVFQAWSEKPSFGAFEPNPDLKQALDKARKLGVSLVLTVQAVQVDQNFVANAELFVDGRSKWKFGPKDPKKGSVPIVTSDGKFDEKATRQLQAKMAQMFSSDGAFTVYTGGLPDWDATARSLANTWCNLLGEGPFKNYPQQPKSPTGGEVGGSVASISTTTLSDAQSDQVVDIANGLITKGKLNQALSLLRQACDLRPFEVKVRKALSHLLILCGMPREGAGVAQAAARIQPSDPSLWLSVAQAWVAAGDIEKAQDALKEAQSRGVDGATMERISADILMLQGNPHSAVEHYQKSGSEGSKLRIAVAWALLGEIGHTQEALLGVSKETASLAEYSSIIGFIDATMTQIAEASRAVPPMVRLHPGEPDTLKEAERVARQCEALNMLVAAIVPPATHVQSHEARKLAHILLFQATSEALQFAKTNDPDIGEETVATLGQALKLFGAVKDKFVLERRYGGL